MACGGAAFEGGIRGAAGFASCDFALDWLGKCSRFPDQSPSCVASVRLLQSMVYRQLGRPAWADPELMQGREMVENHFRHKLELGDNKTGKLQGWIMTIIFLHEAEDLAKNPPRIPRS